MAFSIRCPLRLTLSRNFLAFTLEFMRAAELFWKGRNKSGPIFKTEFLKNGLGYAKRKIKAEETIPMAGDECD